MPKYKLAGTADWIWLTKEKKIQGCDYRKGDGRWNAICIECMSTRARNYSHSSRSQASWTKEGLAKHIKSPNILLFLPECWSGRQRQQFLPNPSKIWDYTSTWRTQGLIQSCAPWKPPFLSGLATLLFPNTRFLYMLTIRLCRCVLRCRGHLRYR